MAELAILSVVCGTREPRPRARDMSAHGLPMLDAIGSRLPHGHDAAVHPVKRHISRCADA